MKLKSCPKCKGMARVRYHLSLNWVECKQCGYCSKATADSFDPQDGLYMTVDEWNKESTREEKMFNINKI